MPISVKASELLADGKLYYGDPCYDATWGSTKEACREVGNPGNNLALQVLNYYNIPIAGSMPGGNYANDYLCCCPLDIWNQDPIQVMNMSLSAFLLDELYVECYADEFGQAKFVKVLEGSNENSQLSPLPRIQYCIPTIQPADVADLVIVRGAEPAPFRKCGDWYTVFDGTVSTLRNRNHIFFDAIPSDADIANYAQAVAFTWGEATGFNPNFGGTFAVDNTCEFGTFNQQGTIIYPDFERKQIYADGIRDLFEIEGFEQILFWIKDVEYNASEAIMQHYSINFTKASELPVNIPTISKLARATGREYFGPICDVVEGDVDYDRIVRSTYLSSPSSSIADLSCQSIQAAIQHAQSNKSYVAWAEYSIPSFYDYAIGQSTMSFKEVTRWNVVGTSLCDDNPFESVYEASTGMMATASVLDFKPRIYRGTEFVDFGYQKESRTIDIANGYWMEITPEINPSAYESGKPMYAFRAAAPSSESIKYGDQPWQNNVYATGQLLTMVYNRYGGTGQTLSTYGGDYNPPGYLMGIDNSLFLLHDIWAKATVNRPGIHIQGHGRGVDSLLPTIKLKVMPVYRVDFPAAYAAAGEEWPATGCDYCIDPYAELLDSKYCEVRVDEPTCSEKLQEASKGNVIDITLPFLFPDFSKYDPQPGGSTGGSREAFTESCGHCARVAKFLWNYIKKYKDNPNKSYTYICGPPKSQSEVPQLGYSIKVPGGDTRCVNSISYSYSDSSAFTVNIEVGPVHVASAMSGRLTKKRTSDITIRGKIVSHEYGALYKVDIPGLGVVKAWNIDTHPWDTGDRVDVTLYNHPFEI